MMSAAQNAKNEVRSPFQPILLIGCCLFAFLAIQAKDSVQMYRNLNQRETQMMPSAMEGQNWQMRLRGLCADLIKLSATDRDAKELVQTFKIAYTPGPGELPTTTIPAKTPAK